MSRARIVATALVAVASCTAAAGSYAVQAGEQHQIVTAEFKDVSPLLAGNDIKIHGVKVGEVAGIVEDNGIAKVAMSLGPEALPIHADARATVRPVSLLGERYLDLDTGTTQAPVLPQGGVIPLSHTGRNTDLDEVLNTFDDPTGRSLAAFVAVLGNGMKGNGANVDAAVRALAPAMTHTDRFMKVLQQQNATLNSLVDSVTPVASSLAEDNGRTMDNLVASTTSLLGTTSANVAALNATLDQLPGSLAAARSTLGQLADTADQTAPLLRDIRPTTDNLTEISEELDDFSDSADPALDKLVPVLDKGTEMLREAEPVAQRLHEMGPDVNSTAQGLRPVVRDLSANVDNVLNFIRFWALTTNGRDGLSHYFRAHLVVEPDSVTGNIPGGPRTKLPTVPKVPTGLLQPGQSPDGGVTGLNPRQEGDALGFLLGGDR